MATEFNFSNLPDLDTDVKVSHVRELLRRNDRLDHLRDRAEEMHAVYGERPKTFGKMCEEWDQKAQGRPGASRLMSVVAGVAMGAALLYGYRNVARRNHGSYWGAMTTGGTAGFAVEEWQLNKKELAALDARIYAYEEYLNKFEEAMTTKQPAPELNTGTPCDPAVQRGAPRRAEITRL